MLLAVEGGGFFSSSASGYTKGLSLLFLGQKNKDKPMRVSPWNQYQLVDQEPELDLQLASITNRFSSGCASFICFGRTSAGVDSPSPLKVGPVHKEVIVQGPLVSDNGNDLASGADDTVQDRVEGAKEHHTVLENGKTFALKSSLKKPSDTVPAPLEGATVHDMTCEGDSNLPSNTDKRKVQWTDACGSELAEVKEFEPSEKDGSDDEFDNGPKSCSCTIM